MATCGFPMRKPLLARPPLAIVPKAAHTGRVNVLRAGWNSPPAVKVTKPKPASAFLATGRASRFGAIPKPTVKVRMTENGRDSRLSTRRVVPYALILVLIEESHESDDARRSRSKRSFGNNERPGSQRSACGSRAPAIHKTTAGRFRAVRLAPRGDRTMPPRIPRRDRGTQHRARAHRSVRGAGIVRNPSARTIARQDPALHRDRRGGAGGR